MTATTTAASQRVEATGPDRRNHEVEGLRAVAALAVLVTHVSLNAMGNKGPFGGLLARLDVGVAVFFVLSGYLLYRPMAAALLRGEPLPSTRRYLRHRLIRIVPAYWVVVIASFLFAPAVGLVMPTTDFSTAPAGVTDVPLWTMLRFLTFTQVYWKDSLAGPFPQAWTLATEMAFYLTLPLLARAIAKRNRGDRPARLRRQWMVLAAMVVVAQLYRLVMVVFSGAYGAGAGASSYTQLGAWLPNHLDLFAVGMGIAVIVVERDDRGPGRRIGRGLDALFARRGAAGISVLVALGLLALAGYGLGLSRTDLSYGRLGEFLRHFAYLGIAAAMVLPTVFGRAGGGAFRWFLRTPVMQYLGRISYGIYLWQILVIGRWVSSPFSPDGVFDAARHPGRQFNVPFWTTLTWTVLVTIALASITWYVVERPWLKYRDRKLGFFAGGVWTISLVSLATRIWAIGTATRNNPGNGDPFYYHAQANMLADGVGFGEPIQWLTEGRFVPSAIHPPLFTLWLTPASLLGARGFLTHKTMAALAGVLVVVAAALLARRLAGDRAGVLAALAVALAPNLWIIDGTLWPEGLYTAVVGFALVLAYRWRDAPTYWRAAALGAMVGLSVLTRGEALFLLPMLCLPLAISARRTTPRWWMHAAVMGAATLGVMAPWTVRNLVRFERPVPVSTNSEEVLFYANCPDTYYGPLPGYWSFGCQERVRQERLAEGLPADPPGDESERAAGWGELGRDYAREHQDRLPRVITQRVLRVWDLRYSDSNLGALQIEGRPRGWSEAGLLWFRLSMIGGIAGFVVLRRRRVMVWPLISMLAMVTITAAAVYGHVRFRTTADFVLLVGAAVAVDALIRRLQVIATAPAEAGEPVLEPVGVRSWARFKPTWRSAASIGIVALVLAIPMRALLRYQGPPMEEGFMLVFPERLLAGDLPHKDFLHLYGPGSLWALAAWFKVFGTTLFTERVFGIVQLAGIVFGVMALSWSWGRRVATMVGVFGVLLTVTAIGLTALAWDGAVALLLASVWAGLRARRWLTEPPEPDAAAGDGTTTDGPSDAERRARRLLILSGVLAGCALLFRPDVIVATALGTFGLMAGLGWARWRRWLMGVVPVLALYLVHLALSGPGNVIKGMLLEPVFDLRGGRSLPRPPSWDTFDGALQKVSLLRPQSWALPTLESPQQAFVWFFLLPAATVFVLGVGWWRVRAEPGRWQARVVLTVGLLGLGLMPQAIQRADTTHLAWVSCVTLAFLPVAFAEAFAHLRAPVLRRWAPTWAVLVVALIPLFVIPHFTSRIYLDLADQSASGDVFGYPVTFRGRTFYLGAPDIAPVAQRMLEEVGPQMAPGESVFVGTADLRKTPYSDAYLYHLLPDNPPATRYIEMDPGMANAPGSGMAEEVAAADWLILSHVWDAWEEPNDSRGFGPDDANQVVRDDFCPVGDYAPYFEVYRRCS